VGIVLGAGATLVHVGAHAFAIDISPMGRRGRFFGQTQAAMHLASLVGPVAVGAIAGWWGFGAAFFVLAALFATMAPVGIVMARHKASRRDAAAGV
jgi:MFS family permease